MKKIPVSLRFDDDNSPFYLEFIEARRKDRDLSPFIVDLLHVYYENESVREIVDKYQGSNNPYLQIQERLQAIVLEHNKQAVATSMIKDYTTNEFKKADMEGVDVPTPKSEHTQTAVAEFAALMQANPIFADVMSQIVSVQVTEKLSGMNEVITQLSEKIKGFEGGATQPVATKDTEDAPVPPMIDSVPPTPAVSPVTGAVLPVPLVVTQPIVEPSGSVEVAVTKPNDLPPPIDVAPKVITPADAPVFDDAPVEPPKPAAFRKMMKSIGST